MRLMRGNPVKWRRWFAWRPVWVKHGDCAALVFWEPIERRPSPHGIGNEYRLPGRTREGDLRNG